MEDKTLKYDILKELFNISVGKAASMLSEITNKKILLNVPDLKVLDCETKELDLIRHLPQVLDGTLMVSSIYFEEKLTGKANLIFPAEKMRTFINICLNENGNDPYYEMNFTDIDFDIIKEVGNIILNSVVGEVGNYLSIDMNYTLPEVKIFNKIDYSRDVENKGYTQVLMLCITFIIDDTEIEGAIVVDLTLKSFETLMQQIDKLEDELYA